MNKDCEKTVKLSSNRPSGIFENINM